MTAGEALHDRAERRQRWLRARLWTLRRVRGLTTDGILLAASLWRYPYSEQHPSAEPFRRLTGITEADMAAAAMIVKELGLRLRPRSRRKERLQTMEHMQP